MKYFVILTLALIGFSFSGKTQCTPLGDETTYGNGSWIGYVYSARENFTTGFYIGYTTESEIFNRDFGNDSVVTNGCKTDPTTFSVRYKMQKTFACGFYNITIGGDDGVRLSIDGGSTYLINGYFPQSYTTFSETVFLNGTYDFVIEYFEAYGDNRVSFSYSSGLGSSFGGEIGSDQEYCGSSGTIAPSVLSSITDAGFCSGGSINYQWQISSDNSTFTNISGATSNSYHPPSGFQLDTTLYYRRKGGNGTDSAYSNTVFISNNSVPGDPNIYGNEEWIGYVYDGTNNFNINDYKGIMVETERFDQSFGGSNTNIPINGCPIVSESFTVRYKMQKTFTHGEYEFTIGGDDGVRLSLDGGATYLINDYTNHGYRTRSAIDTLNGTYNMVLDYFENGGGNRVTFNFTELTPLPVELIKFDGKVNNNQVDLFWITASEINNDYFTLEKSNDNKNFELLTQKVGAGTTNLIQIYEATDD